jgi:hypothetical protein
MRTIETGAAVSASTRQPSAFPKWYHLTALVALPVVFVILPDKNFEHVVQLERLAPRIERAQTLSPEARDHISRVVARQGALAGSGDSSQQLRRTAAIGRVTSALKAKEPSTIASSGARPPQE